MGDFRENCEFSLIREELNVLFRQYRSGKLTSSTAYTESGRLLDYDGRCGEALFLRYKYQTAPDQIKPAHFLNSQEKIRFFLGQVER